MLVMLLVPLAAMSQLKEFTLNLRTGTAVSRTDANGEFYRLLGEWYESTPHVDYKAGAYVSLHADMGFTSMWHLETGLDFAQMGYKPYCEDYSETRDDRLNVYYLQLPVMASCHVDLGRDVSLNLKAGPYLGLGLSGRFESVYYVPGMAISVDAFGTTQYDDRGYETEVRGGLSRFDAGLTFGLELEVSRFTVGANYLLGLVDNYRDSNVLHEFRPETRNRAFTVAVGYNFKVR